MKSIGSMVKGVFLGAIVGVILYFLISFNYADSFDSRGKQENLLMCVGIVAGCSICGGAFGLALGLDNEKKLNAKKVAEEEQVAKSQSYKWVSELRQQAIELNSICDGNKSVDKPMVYATYKGHSQMAEIVDELTKVAELQGEVDFWTEELSKIGGVSV